MSKNIESSGVYEWDGCFVPEKRRKCTQEEYDKLLRDFDDLCEKSASEMKKRSDN